MKPGRNLIQIWFLFAVMVPAAVQAQFNYTINNGTITITGFTGPTSPGGLVIIPYQIPNTKTGLVVTTIGDWAFLWLLQRD